MPKQPLCRIKTRERLLIAAAEEFAAHGYRSTTVRTICAKARANVAAIRYHFGSKDKLYIATYDYVFRDSPIAALPRQPLEVNSAEQWRQELRNWTRLVIEVLTGNEPWQRWQCGLFARERTDPSEVLPVLLERYYLPLQNRLETLLKMALPDPADEMEVVTWRASTIAQCIVYADHKPPWDMLMFPGGNPDNRWLNHVSEHIVNSVTSRLSFRKKTDS